MKHPFQLRRFASMLGIAFVLGVLLTLALSWSTAATTPAGSASIPTLARAGAPGDEVMAAWQRMRDLGAYSMSADLVQTAHPAPDVSNAGQVAHTTSMHMEGQVDLPADRMALQVWPQGGSLVTGEGAIEVEVSGGAARGRTPGQPWQDLDGFPGMFAPGNDFLGFLAGAKEVQRAGTETRAGVTFTRYTFEVDGLRFARYLQDQLQAARDDDKRLPPGLTLQMPDSYREMQGQGELWVRSDGLPLREVVRLSMPDKNRQVEAEIKVDLQPDGSLASLPAAGAAAAAVARGGIDLTGFAAVGALACGLVLTRRSRKTYAVAAIAVVVSMVVCPLAQNVQAASYLAEQAQQDAVAEAAREKLEVQEALQATGPRPGFDPQVNPLQQARAAAAAEVLAGDLLIGRDGDPPASGSVRPAPGARSLGVNCVDARHRRGRTDRRGRGPAEHRSEQSRHRRRHGERRHGSDRLRVGGQDLVRRTAEGR